jgi:hypothetical protein
MAEDARRCAVSGDGRVSSGEEEDGRGNGVQGSHHSARCWLVNAHTKSAISRAELRSTERRYRRCSLLLSGCWPSELATCRG